MTSYSTYNSIKVDRENQNPTDTIQTILWDPYDRSARSFYTCGWDGYVRLYEVEGSSSKRLQKKWECYFEHPIISMDVTSSKHVIVGLATGHVGVVDRQNINNMGLLGTHDAAICKVVWIEKHEVVLTLGFDYVIKVFSLKQSNNNNFQIGQYSLPAKTNTAAFSYPYLLIGSQDSRIAVLNVQNISKISIKDQYQCIFDESHGIVKFTASAISAQRKKIIFGTADGRIVNSTFQESSYSNSGMRIMKPVVTKHQKKVVYRKDHNGQINSLDFGCKDRYEFLLFCGSFESGIYSTDKFAKIKSITNENSPTLTAIAISPDCEYYASAVGYDWLRGLDDVNKQPPRIYVCRISNTDLISNSQYMR